MLQVEDQAEEPATQQLMDLDKLDLESYDEEVKIKGQFKCKMTDLKLMVTMLQDILWTKKRGQIAQVIIDKLGITFICEMDKSMQARAFLLAKMFDSFTLYNTTQMKLSLDLWTFLECIRVYAGSSIFEMEITDKKKDAISLILQDIPNQVVTRCFVRLYTYEDFTDFNFVRGTIANSCTVASQHFRDAFSELDALGKDDNVVSFRIVAGTSDEYRNIHDNELGLIDLPNNQSNNFALFSPSHPGGGGGGDGGNINEPTNPIQTEHNTNAMNINTNSNAIQMQGKGKETLSTGTGVSKKSKFTIVLECDSHTMEADFPVTNDIFQIHDFKETKIYQYRMRLFRAVLRSMKGAERTRFFFGKNNVLRVEQLYTNKNITTWVAFYISAIEIP